MHKIDDILLEQELKKRHISNAKFAVMLDISPSTLWKKRKGVSDFTRRELCTASQVFGKETMLKVFF